MHSDNKPQDLSKLSEQLSIAENTIRDLEATNHELESTVLELTSERDRLVVENQLAIEDAELTRNFKRTNYAPLVEELFAEPAKELQRKTTSMIMVSIVVTLGLAYLLSGYLVFQNNEAIQNELVRLNKHVNLLREQSNNPEKNHTANLLDSAISTPPQATASTSDTEASTTHSDTNITENKSHKTKTDEIVSNNIPETITETQKTKNHAAQISAPTDPEAQRKNSIIEKQAASIIKFIKTGEGKKGFPNAYRTAKDQFAQLYLITMQQAGNTNLYYESYLNAMKTLSVSSEVLPATVDDMAMIDKEFIHAIYAAYVITHKKKTKQWRYRDIDSRFSTYYSNNSHYNLGGWKISNKKKDYSELPKIYAINIKNVMQQFLFNNQQKHAKIPNKIYYSAYSQDNKNKAVFRLFDNKPVTVKKEAALELDVSRHALTLKKDMIYLLQKKLAEQGFMSASIINGRSGPKTAAAITEYRIQNDLNVTRNIDLELLASLELHPTYNDLELDLK